MTQTSFDLYSLPKRPKLRSLQANQDYKGLLAGSELVKQSTADHKVLTEGTEFRNDHRYAVVVKDLATQWIQSYPCKAKTYQETERSLRKFFEPSEKLESHLYQQFIGIWQVL